MATEDAYRESARRTHRLLASYLAIWGWTNGVDCVCVNRSTLHKFLGFAEQSRMTKKRIEWLKEDVAFLFPIVKAMYLTSSSRYSAMWMSRMDLPKKVMAASISTKLRISVLEDHGIAAAETTIPAEKDIVRILSLMLHGIEEFPTK